LPISPRGFGFIDLIGMNESKTASKEASMKRQSLILTLLLALTALLLVACGSVQHAPSSVSNSPEYVLTLEITATDMVADIETRYGGKVVIWQPQDGYAVLGLGQAPSLETLATTAALEPNQGKIWGGGILATMSGTVSVWSGGRSVWSGGRSVWSGGIYQVLPQNTDKWQRMQLEAAHAYAANLGEGVKVAVIDSGVDLQHPAFVGSFVPASEMKDYVGNDAVPQEEGVLGTGAYGHGTSVAGIVLQIAPKAKILPIRVLGPDGSGDVINVAAAINYAVSKGAHIINLSLGSDVRSDAIAGAITTATNNGVYVISSSGNAGTQSITYPAREASADTQAGWYSVSVGSVKDSDAKSDFSTYGVDLEIVGPGEVVYGPVPGNRLGAWTGTSMSAPMVTGAIALALGNDAGDSGKKLTDDIINNATDIYNATLNTTYITGQSPNETRYLGKKGRLNVYSFLQSVQIR
jgi:thermitase